MRTAFTWTAALLASASPSFGYGEPDLKYEHAGDVFLRANASTGVTRTVNGESLYLAYPPHHNKTDNAVLYLTDIFGVQLVNNRILADSLAKAGYLVVAPDLFKGDPVPADALSDPNPTFNMTAWRERHPQAAVEAIIESAIGSIRSDFKATRVGSVGYCFGGKYVARFLAEGKGLDVGFTAHPSAVLAEEWGAITKPISIAFGELDASNTPDNRTTIESIFIANNKTFQTSLYADAEHGFAVRTNLTDKKKAFAQESAYFQAVRWLDAWAKED